VLKNKQHIGGLDLVRFFAAFAVLMFHLAVFSWAGSGGLNFGVQDAPQYPDLVFLRIGRVGVEIFFVLSGFVIAQSAEANSAYRFLRGRVGRLVPAVWVCTTLTSATVLLFGLKDLHTAVADYARSLIFDPHGPWVSGVYWTLTLEITFYALIFLLLLIDQFKQIEKFATALGTFSAVYIVGRSFYGFPSLPMHLLAQHGCFFSLGIFLWLICAKNGSAFRYIMVIVMMVMGVIEINYVAHVPLTGYEFIAAPAVWLASILAIWLSASRNMGGSVFARKLGLMTYPLYLIHEVIGSMILRVNPWTGKYLALLIAAGAMVAVSWLVIEVEPSLRRWLEAKLDMIAKYFVPKWYAKAATPSAVTQSRRPSTEVR
jgi:peptidoglycan/LPS O-acetylase OafA/YrhL